MRAHNRRARSSSVSLGLEMVTYDTEMHSVKDARPVRFALPSPAIARAIEQTCS